jgi:hypothetical protein
MYLFDDSNNNMIQFKMEYGDCIIGDIFTSGGEHVDSIACHDFNDDVQDIDKPCGCDEMCECNPNSVGGVY